MNQQGKVAYLILAHRDEPHLADLVEALNYCSDFYIYVDKKSDITKFKELLSKYSNVFFMKKRENIKWGGFSQVVPAIDMLKAAIDKHYIRYVFLTGADYPLLSSVETYNYLTSNIAKEYICGINIANNSRFIPKASQRWFFGLDAKGNIISRAVRRIIDMALKVLPARKTICRTKTKTWDIYYGFAYWGITDACAKYVLQVINIEKKLVNYIKWCYAPIEILIHTIVFNSEFAVNAKLYESVEYDIQQCAPLHYVQYNEMGSRVLDETDYEKVISSGKLFIMKTDSEKSRKLIEMINEKNITKET